MSNVTMRDMLEAGVHFGHQARYWDPKMAPYLFGRRNKIYIINLEKTLPLYREAMNFIGKVAAKKGTILFVGTKRAAQAIIQEEAMRCGMPYISRRWLGGLLTNFETVKRSVNRLKELEEMQADDNFEWLSKKEALTYTRELAKLNASLSGVKDMSTIPDVLFVVDVGYENIAVKEATRLHIPVVGIVDSNNSPDNVDYVIPGNDDAIRSIRLYAKGAADAILEARSSLSYIAGGVNPDELAEMGEKDDFVELDETGAPVARDAEKGNKVSARAERKTLHEKKAKAKLTKEKDMAIADTDTDTAQDATEAAAAEKGDGSGLDIDVEELNANADNKSAAEAEGAKEKGAS